MLDRNKSDLTHELTAAAALYLEGHGFKPVETEVAMPRADWRDKDEIGWIADLASFIHPTQTELIEMRMLPRRPRWPGYEHKDDAARMRRWREADAAWEARRDPLLRRLTALVEVKATRADWRGDRKWVAPCWPVDLAYLAVPRGMLRPEEYPAGWGILEGGSRCIRPPEARSCSIEQHLAVISAIAVRRDHHTRHARWREYQRKDRIEVAERRGETRIRKIAQAILAVTRGRYQSVDLCLAAFQIEDLPEALMEQIRPLWNIMPQ